MRFDMRAPGGPATMPALYDAAVDMAVWAEDRGGVACVISEHHASPDGYLPSPLLLATAMAARTTRMPFTIAAGLLCFYDPIRLAEDMTILDVLSHGRVSYVMALGYRPEEFALYGVAWEERGRVAEEKLGALLAALRGEVVEYGGRRGRIMPAPVRPIRISWGGGTPAAARRAARHGLDLFAEGGGPDLQRVYEEEARRHGREPGLCMVPSPGTPTTVFVADDVDRAWQELGPHMLHDIAMYGEWNAKAGKQGIASLSAARTVEELRDEQGSYRVYSVAEAVGIVKGGGLLSLQPLCGGLPPDVAWKYLEVVTDEVMPAAKG